MILVLRLLSPRIGCWLLLALCAMRVQAVPVDGDTIRADTLYMLRGGKVVEVES